jgi:hypothetical protein
MVWYSSLPTAELKVDNNQITFRYLKSTLGSISTYKGANRSHFTAVHLNAVGGAVVNNVSSITRPDKPEVSAMLTIDGIQITFPMYKSTTRCECPTPVPHWTGTLYKGVFFQDLPENENITGIIELVVRDQGIKRRKEKQEPVRKTRQLFQVPSPA